MPNEITDADQELLDDLGVETAPVSSGGRSAREQRIIAGFEEIERFVQEHGTPPQHGETRDIFERLYAVRLDRMRESVECRGVLEELDSRGLLGGWEASGTSRVMEETDDVALLDSLGVEAERSEDLTQLVHVRSREEIKAAEEVAQRNPCANFEEFRPIFEKVRSELLAGVRQTLKYKDNAEVKDCDLFILDGQKLIVADMGESFVSGYGRPDRRLKVVYDNGTESDLLVRSLQRALNKDKGSRRITNPEVGPLFADAEEKDDLATGYIYVLRSKSTNPFVAAHRSAVHKIGVTGGDVKRRLVNAAKDPTYLLAEVEVVSTYKLLNIHRTRLEALLHRFFASVRLDLELKDRFGGHVEPREWFLVPLPAIDEMVQRLKDGSIEQYRYDPEAARLVKRFAS